jgi:hypothetical protein
MNRVGSDGRDTAASRAMASRGAKLLKRKRIDVKYILPGLQEPLRVLSRSGDWMSNFAGKPEGVPLLRALQELGGAVDATVIRSYRRGRPPGWWEQKRVQQKAREARRLWEARFGPDADEDESAAAAGPDA